MEEYTCELCESDVEFIYDLIGCEHCAMMFGPCCSSAEHDDLCCECAISVGEDYV